ncbi:hypothetical protein K438DRAFT_1911289 [Mycena galopus ATCC 62051]|nr:hypothetical protein K438DRAFT_1911289 [Mycena galopus ATCC 62051]
MPSEMTETSDSERGQDEPIGFRTIPHPRQQTPEASTSHINAMDVDEEGCIRTCISNISLPTWVARPPRNLGEASHGKLKAYESLILFTVIFPLIIPELWWGKGATELAFLQNFHHLVACTNIVSSFSTSNTLADLFTDHYVKYRKALPQLFPIKFKSVSNHHFAQHNGSLLKFWGPFGALNEFAGERMNGMLQKIKTNRNTDDMPLTMLRQMARRGRLEAKLSDDQVKGGLSGQLAEILQPATALKRHANNPLSEVEVTKILASRVELDTDDYEMLLEYQNSSKGQLWRSCYDLPHPPGSLILPPCAMKPKHSKLGDQTFSCFNSRKNSGGIQFKDPVNPSCRLTGFIIEIWQIPLDNHMQTFFLVQKHKNLSVTDLLKTPFVSFPLFETTAVDAENSNNFCINFLTHLTFYHHPRGTYGINKCILVICCALNRGRRF